ncbi:BTB/POZ domain-containing protein KCTD11 [Paroedura picta]|uniref:BTB/POZ domain-containing protein KCTD11 n=1 Tax=Paroedura picta TaxID=143630 RepID=UPI004057AE6A
MPDSCEARPRPGGPVTLNVGGKLYSTSVETLTRFPDSMLGAMFRGPRPARTDGRGNYFIDRDGKAFRHILNFLRLGRLDLPDGYAELPLLRAEADFYQIRPLLEALRREEAERRRQSTGALLHADVDARERLLHFNVRRGPQNYELCTCSLRLFTANVFCTDPCFLAALRRRLGRPEPAGGRREEGLDGPDAPTRDAPNGRKRPEDERGTSGKEGVCPADSSDDEAEPSGGGWGAARGLSKARHHLSVEWAPRPAELPAAEYAKQKLRPLRAGGREVRTGGELLEEVLKAALAHGFRVDSVFPDQADILSAHSLRFLRH